MKFSKKGFTLIELLMTIAIIAILSSTVLAVVGVSRTKARDAKRISAVGEIQKAMELFYDARQGYPTTTPTGFSGADAALQMMYVAGFLKNDPSISGNTYTYYGGIGHQNPFINCVLGQCHGYSLSVLLERDDNANLAKDADARVLDAFGVAIFDGNSGDCGSGVSLPELCLDQTALQIQQ